MKKLYGLVTGLALGLGLFVGAVSAEERFTTLEGIQTEALSASEMAEVQGKFYDYLPLGGFNWARVWVDDRSGHTWHVPTGTYLGRRQLPTQYTLQQIKNLFPDSYRSPIRPSTTGSFFGQQTLGGIFSKDLVDAHSLPFGSSTRPGSRR